MNSKLFKIVFISLLLLPFMGQGVQAQENKKHEIAISYGALPNSDWVNIFEDIIVVPFEKANRKNETHFGTISAEYFYNVSSLIGLGAVAGYGHRSYDLYDGDVAKGEQSDSYYTLMPAVKFNWVNKKHFGFYSKAAMGATLRSEKNDAINYSESAVHFNFQASFIGLEAGSSSARGFIELGLGEQGVFVGGLRFKF
jgi:hypothetical protein